jgi:hypothetical protein
MTCPSRIYYDTTNKYTFITYSTFFVYPFRTRSYFLIFPFCSPYFRNIFLFCIFSSSWIFYFLLFFIISIFCPSILISSPSSTSVTFSSTLPPFSSFLVPWYYSLTRQLSSSLFLPQRPRGRTNDHINHRGRIFICICNGREPDCMKNFVNPKLHDGREA